MITASLVQLKWIEEPKDVVVAVGNQLNIPCSADGSPKPKIEWSKVGGGKDSLILGTDSLSFRSVNLSDEGYYECRAKNGLEKDLLAVIKLDVLGK